VGVYWFFFSEANTFPGFTAVSQYPQIWAAAGLPYPELLSHGLLSLSLVQHGCSPGSHCALAAGAAGTRRNGLET
jgi:hypothetical protein